MLATGILVFVAFFHPVDAHIALWDKGLFGLNYPYQSDDPTNNNYNNDVLVHPLREDASLSISQWFGHGMTGYPPKAGDFMTLSSGGTYNGEVACNRGETTLRDPRLNSALFKYACSGDPGVGALHVMNTYNGSVYDTKWFGGSAIAIAYTSNVAALRPDDMTVISVNQNSVWTREISYAIPAGMPACPAGGCLCTWNWIHEGGHGEGYAFEIYNNLYRCQVIGATSTTRAVQRGAIPKECDNNLGPCVTGPKTPMYLYQAEGNNLPSLDTPPSYNNAWGFADGAQNDIFSPATNPAPTGTIAPTPTATSIPSGWTALGCQIDDPNVRALDGGSTTVSNNTISSCVASCARQGFNYAGVEYGDECWCGKNAKLNATSSSDCNVACPGDIWSMCGGGYRLNVFRGPNAPTTTYTPTSFPTASIPSGWSSLGCNTDDPNTRTLDSGETTFANNTIPGCIANCASRGFPYAGVENGQECWCGKTARLSAASSGCSVPCTGDGTTFCGGAYRINVFAAKSVISTTSLSPTSTVRSTTIPSSTSSTPKTSSTASSLTSTTSLAHSSLTSSFTTAAPLSKTTSVSTLSTLTSTVRSSLASSLTSSKVTSTSSASSSSSTSRPTSSSSTPTTKASSSSSTTKASSISLSTTPSSSSFTTKTSSSSSTTKASSISSIKSASSAVTTTTKTTTTSSSVSTMTKSSSASSPTSTPLPSGWVALGCNIDSTPRILNGTSLDIATNSYAQCIAVCSTKGFIYAGVENGYQCYCGNTATLNPTSSGCSMACPGDSSELCGGAWRINIFHKATQSTTSSSSRLVARRRRRRG